ncbi:Frag1/DRAM/Sfk1 [Pholiota molesta]|nr:Frag1/DRAM/Sfk1 [Pholiota molesta]
MSSHIPLRYRHWYYVWIPIAASVMWFSTLLAMLIVWLAQGRPKYPTQSGKVAYISDIGASSLKPLFITGCAITGLGFFLCLLVERLLRHTGRLVPNMRKRERVFSILAIIGSAIGGLGLLLLSIFDTDRFHRAHRAFLLVFIVGVGLSAIFSITEYRWISKDFREIKKLKAAYIAKGIIAATLILLAIVFAVTLYEAPDVGGIFEWIIAFGYTLYLLTYWYDLRLSKNIPKGELKRRYGPHARQEDTVPVNMVQVV